MRCFFYPTWAEISKYSYCYIYTRDNLKQNLFNSLIYYLQKIFITDFIHNKNQGRIRKTQHARKKGAERGQSGRATQVGGMRSNVLNSVASSAFFKLNPALSKAPQLEKIQNIGQSSSF